MDRDARKVLTDFANLMVRTCSIEEIMIFCIAMLDAVMKLHMTDERKKK